jgi:hypothetical protein
MRAAAIRSASQPSHLTPGHTLARHRLPHLFEHFDRQGVDVRVPAYRLEVAEQSLRRLDPRPEGTHFFDEKTLLLGTADIDRPERPVSGLMHDTQAGDDPEAQQQRGNIGGQPMAAGGEIDARRL